jgi:pilus assembly protein Flp/PilA
MEKVWRFLKDEEGTETVEWAIMIGLIAVGAIAIIAWIGGWVSGRFSQLQTNLSTSS